VVTKRPEFHNPGGVEQNAAQASCLRVFVPKQDASAALVYSTPAGSVKTAMSAIHGFRCASPAAIIVITPVGVKYKATKAILLRNQSTQAGCLSYLGGGRDE
jgi:hypothetical protein